MSKGVILLVNIECSRINGKLYNHDIIDDTVIVSKQFTAVS